MERRLTTIMAADLVGYSRLMAADEEGTISRLRDARTYVIDPAIMDGGGRIVKTMGDGLLVDFPSPVLAARAALLMQRNLISREAPQGEDRRLRFRIGIHLGDVVIDGDDILGDCVNITARLETIAPAGGICISRAIYDQVHGKIEAGLTWLGPQSVKNIPEPIDVWQVEVDGTAPSPARRSSPGRASIAVLPFQNFSSTPDQDFFVDGLVEDVITELGRFRWLFVIARNSTFAYKGAAKDVRNIARELGVRYVVEGSVRRSADRLRITVQLIDALSGAHIWAERWDRPIADFFDVQDEITRRIVAGIEPELGAHERNLALAKSTDNLTAWELCHRGLAELLSFEAGSQVAAEKLLRQALEHDANFALPYAYLARHRYALVLWGRAADVPVAVKEGLSFATKALEIDRRNDIAYAMMSLLLTVDGRAAEALPVAELGLTLNPNYAFLHFAHGMAAVRLRDADTTIRAAQNAIDLSPHDPSLFAFKTLLGIGLMLRGEPEDLSTARMHLREGASFERTTYYPFIGAALLALRAGNTDEVRIWISNALKKFPNLNAEYVREAAYPFYEGSPYNDYLDRLIEQGLPPGEKRLIEE